MAADRKFVVGNLTKYWGMSGTLLVGTGARWILRSCLAPLGSATPDRGGVRDWGRDKRSGPWQVGGDPAVFPLVVFPGVRPPDQLFPRAPGAGVVIGD